MGSIWAASGMVKIDYDETMTIVNFDYEIGKKPFALL